jgi:SAM-dependent methyltransferase
MRRARRPHMGARIRMSEERLGAAVTAPRLRDDLRYVSGFGTTIVDSAIMDTAPDTTTAEYGREQEANNARVTREYVEPILRQTGSVSVVDVGCGTGRSVVTLLEDGFNAYGVDLPALIPQWTTLGYPRDRFFVVSPDDHVFPFQAGSIDFIYSFGAIEHIGTVEGHSTRRPDYHAARRHWARELFRALRPGGHMLLGGPNRNFPLDFSHGLDAETSAAERWLSAKLRVSVHRTWGEYFLWSYSDLPTYLHGLPYEIIPCSIRGLLRFGRVPRALRSLAGLYVNNVPSSLLGTGWNPWMMALIRKTT